MVTNRIAETIVTGCVLSIAFNAPAVAACGPVLPAGTSSEMSARRIAAADLIELREIGSHLLTGFGGESPLAVSPDGKWVAFSLMRADLASNGQCRALLVGPVDGRAPPRVLDQGGEMLLTEDPMRGSYVAGGRPDPATPIWSPDGRRIAWRRRDNGTTRAWVVDVASGVARPVSPEQVEVRAVAWSDGDGRLLYAVRAGEKGSAAALAAEGRTGWRYDERFAPDISARPGVPVATSFDVFAVDLANGEIEAADADAHARLGTPDAPAWMVKAQARSPGGAVAAATATHPSPFAPTRLAVTRPDGGVAACAAAACAGFIVGVWWDGEDVLFLKREGWHRETLGLYRWRPGAQPPRAVLRTLDVLHHCAKARAALVCTHETSVRPRRLAAIDTATGRIRELFDPNPDFARLTLGPVQRLRWRNDRGLEAWGDLVLPPNHQPGTRLPLVVVQYESYGFLRGGTGDEYPIFLLADRGFAVLSIQRQPFIGSIDYSLTTPDQINAASQRDWADRWSSHSTLMTGVAKVVAGGWADPKRVGITGLSDGATTTTFALINADAFAAAAISSCCFEPGMAMAFGGPAWADQLRSFGYPSLTAPDPDFWKPMSLVDNAARLDTPLLMQLADSEFRGALESFSALREQGQPVEMYVFPDELHIKVQPLHRLAVYDRNLDWFAFWLQGREDPDPAKSAQYARWRALRSAPKLVEPREGQGQE